MQISESWAIFLIVYCISAILVVIPIIASIFSKKVNDWVGLESWGDFAVAMVMAMVPLFNTFAVLFILFCELPSIPAPKHWGRKS